jgi:urease gamma subunit
MCEKCDQIAKKTERLQELARLILDQQMLKGIADLLAELEVEKATLHGSKLEE